MALGDWSFAVRLILGGSGGLVFGCQASFGGSGDWSLAVRLAQEGRGNWTLFLRRVSKDKFLFCCALFLFSGYNLGTNFGMLRKVIGP